MEMYANLFSDISSKGLCPHFASNIKWIWANQLTSIFPEIGIEISAEIEVD